MLKLLSEENAVLNVDDFYITEKSSGLDELIFNISIYDENYPKILEEAIVEYEQPYLVKAIDAGKDSAKVKCQIDIDDLKADMFLQYTNGSNTLGGTIDGVLPSGWVFVDHSANSIRRTIEGEAFTAYEIIEQCAETYGVVFRYDVKNKQVHAYDMDSFEPLGAFATRELNLTEINYKGKSTDFYTRLYAYGKDGISFADINDGKPYVEYHGYSDKVISAYWQDDRYTVAENLLAAAQEQVEKAGIPSRSYECTVYDLAATNPELYGFQDFSLFSVVKLIDDIKNISINYQVVEYQRYPYYPEKNVVTLSSEPAKIQNTVKNIQNEINNPQSSFNTGIKNSIDNAVGAATDWITGVNGGYIVFHKNQDDQPYEMLIMDTPDISTAKKVWRWNQNGLGFSNNGYGGPYTTAITQDGQIVANFITAGQMSANHISAGTIEGKIIAKDLIMQGGTIDITTDEDGNKIVINGKTTTGSDTSIYISCVGVKSSYVNESQGTKGSINIQPQAIYIKDEKNSRSITMSPDLVSFTDVSGGIKIENNSALLYNSPSLVIDKDQISLSYEGQNYNERTFIHPDGITVKGIYGINYYVSEQGGAYREGVSGTFTSNDGKTIEVINGIIVDI